VKEQVLRGTANLTRTQLTYWHNWPSAVFWKSKKKP